MLVDSHCHLDFPEFASELPALLERAREVGVNVMQTICTRLTHFPMVRKIAEDYPQIVCSVGVHPNEVATQPEVSLSQLVEYAAHPRVVGLGETGLDFYYESSPREAQFTSFLVHIEAARVTGLPVIIHTRHADTETIKLLETEMKKGPFTGVLHCFTSGPELAKVALELGFYISISGIVTFKNAKDLQAIVKTVPLEQLLVETDAPYLAPVPYRGKRNEPAYTYETAKAIAALKEMPLKVIENHTTANFFNLFSKAEGALKEHLIQLRAAL